ncbi:MAG: hypothetical protein AAF664_16840 [Planctomycetota bacterium]
MSADEIRSDIAEGYYVCSISNESFSKTRLWRDTQSAPPLSVENAIRSATRWINREREGDKLISWKVHHIEITRKSSADWYYIVTFRSQLKPTSKPNVAVSGGPGLLGRDSDLRVPVFMDGSIPKMSFHRYSDRLLEIIEGLRN